MYSMLCTVCNGSGEELELVINDYGVEYDAITHCTNCDGSGVKQTVIEDMLIGMVTW